MCIMNVAKGDVVDASGSLHLCAGQTSGSEAVYIGMYTMFEVDDTDAVLLIDSSNALKTRKKNKEPSVITMSGAKMFFFFHPSRQGTQSAHF